MLKCPTRPRFCHPAVISSSYFFSCLLRWLRQCHDGTRCVYDYDKCDGTVNCADGSDESDEVCGHGDSGLVKWSSAYLQHNVLHADLQFVCILNQSLIRGFMSAEKCSNFTSDTCTSTFFSTPATVGNIAFPLCERACMHFLHKYKSVKSAKNELGHCGPL